MLANTHSEYSRVVRPYCSSACLWQCEEEGGTLSLFRFHPDAATETFHDPFTDCQTDAASRAILAVQTLERIEDFVQEFRRYSDSVVGAGEAPHGALFLDSDGNCRWVDTPVVDGIADEI